ncbi:MAG TPA: glycosyltransferase [Candidatus Paceibacterota bacterium]
MYDKSKIEGYFNKIASERNYWKKKNRYYYNYIEKFASFLIPEGKRVLEVGCGTGELLAALKPSRGLGVDFSLGMIKIANTKHGYSKNLEFRVVDVENKEWGVGEKFDYIIIDNTLGYINDIELFFKKLNDFIDPNGKIIIIQYNQLWEPILVLGAKLKVKMPFIYQSWLSLADIENFFYLAGFEVVKNGSKLLFPKYVPVISSFCNKFLANITPFNKLGLVNFLVARPVSSALHLTDLIKLKKNYPVSIIVPARNEAGMIKKIVDELPELGKLTEVIFVEGYSRDNTHEEIKKVIENYHGSKILRFTVQDGVGKGDAVRKGFDMATGDILMVYDADMTVPPRELSKFYEAITIGRGEFINGSRLIYPMEKQSMRLLNYAGNKFFGFMFSWLLGQRLKDTLCGTKVLWKHDYEDIKKNRSFFGDFDPFGDFDLLFGAAKLNLKIINVPIHYRERTYGTTNIQRWSHGWLLLKMVIFAMRKIKFI